MSGLVSVAGLIGARVTTSERDELGRLVDVVVEWGSSSYPEVIGLVVRIGQRRAFVRAAQVGEIGPQGVQLVSARLDLRDFVRRPGEVVLARDVLDHQVVDVDGARVVRTSDLYLAQVGSGYRLVGADAGAGAFLRRVGPARWRRTVVPERVIDWADVAPFSAPGAPVRLRASHQALRELRPAELADLLEDLGRAERHELLTTLAPETAADVLEEMGAAEVTELLREAAPDHAAGLIARMEPDEAIDALRDLSEHDREAIVAALPADTAEDLTRLLSYPEREAAGFMTTRLALVRPGETVAAVRAQLQERHRHGADIDAVVVVDDDGRLVDDVPLLDLLVAEPHIRVEELIGPPWPVTVAPDASPDDVVDRLINNRSSSLLVVDADERPLGRILADDVLDLLVAGRSRRWPWQAR